MYTVLVCVVCVREGEREAHGMGVGLLESERGTNTICFALFWLLVGCSNYKEYSINMFVGAIRITIY